MSQNAPRAAVVGAGPSGFYATDQLLKAGFEVDLLEILPTPFGLVRAGVAPDHPKIKSVTRMYEKTAKHPGFRFFGGVELGAHVGRQDLLDRYHLVLYAVGTASDNRLGIPGEDLPGSCAATDRLAVEAVLQALDLLVVGRDAAAQQAPRGRQALEDVDLGVAAGAQQAGGRECPRGAGADDRNPRLGPGAHAGVRCSVGCWAKNSALRSSAYANFSGSSGSA